MLILSSSFLQRRIVICFFFFFSSRRRHTRCSRDWSSDVCSSDLDEAVGEFLRAKKRGMHADDEDFFIVGAIKDADLPAFGDDFVVAPEIVAVQFLRARGFERVNVAALRVDAGHDVLDGAVFAGGVHGLKDEQKSPTILRVKHFLEVAEAGDAVFEQALRGALVLDAVGVGGLEILEAKLFTLGDAVRFDDVRGFFQQLDRKSTRLNSSHGYISYAVFCLKKKKKTTQRIIY